MADQIQTYLRQQMPTWKERYQGVEELKAIAPTVNSVDILVDEEAELRFIKAFRNLMRIRNLLVTFADFDYTELAMTGQEFEDYKSKYLDLYDKVRTTTNKEKVSILDDVDFEVELIHRDEINVRYILQLLRIYHGVSDREREKIRKQIADLLGSEIKLRSKRELILEFIDNNMPNISDADMIGDEFDEFQTLFWSVEHFQDRKQKAPLAIYRDYNQ